MSSEFDQVFEQLEAPEYPATCDNCGAEGTNASMAGHECLTQEEAELVAGAIPLQALPSGPPCVYCSGNGVNCCRTQQLRQQCTAEAAQGIWRVGFNGHEVMCGHDYIVSCTGKKHAKQIVTEHNQYATLVAERKQLLTALKQMLSVFAPYANPDSEQWRTEVEAYDMAQGVLATIEREERGR